MKDLRSSAVRGVGTLFGQRPEQDTHHSKTDGHTEDSADGGEEIELGIDHIAREDIEHRVVEAATGNHGHGGGHLEHDGRDLDAPGQNCGH